MPIFLKVAMKPEKTLGADQRYRIDWPAEPRHNYTR